MRLKEQVRSSAARAMALTDSTSRAGDYSVGYFFRNSKSSDTGALLGSVIQTTMTIAFEGLKPGHYLYPGFSVILAWYKI
jgi:hypothetical protein